MSDLVPVTQADRDAVQDFHRIMAQRIMSDIASERPKLGEDEGDAGTLVQTFARHRLAHSQARGGDELREALEAIANCRIAGDVGFPGLGPTIAQFARDALKRATLASTDMAGASVPDRLARRMGAEFVARDAAPPVEWLTNGKEGDGNGNVDARDGARVGVRELGAVADGHGQPRSVAPPVEGLTAATASPEQVERALLLAEVEFHLQSCRVFLTSRERMHPCGVDLHDELQAKVSSALAAINQEKRNG